MSTATKSNPGLWDKAKAEGNKAGKQFVKQPKSVAKKVAKYRK